ncbi:MAG: FprA family A-type flavoprotein [Oscillospiraceae bacterium]|nr:FprA family A-type flavoprotein [Oscillospiraceae bacterium]
MYFSRKITEDTYYVGASDRRLELFENVFPIPKGVSYNSYVITDEKTALLDLMDESVSKQGFENISGALNGRKLDYVVINHMEPDHCSKLDELILRYPEVKIVGNVKTLKMIGQFYDIDAESRFVTVNEGDTLQLGKHNLTFVNAPMVHWPEVMVTYDTFTKALFSADAFGTFGALGGNIFNDEYDFEYEFLEEARRYYTNIVGKYGMQVQAVLKKASTLDIKYICPLHGPVWRTNIDYIIDKYNTWSLYEPEIDSVMIAYASMYGNTENAVNVLANVLAEKGVKNIKIYDVSKTDVSYVLSDAFKYKRLVFASPTYNGGLYPKMENLLLDLKAHSLKNRKVAVFDNGSWSASAKKHMLEILGTMKVEVVESSLALKSSLKQGDMEALNQLAEEILK